MSRLPVGLKLCTMDRVGVLVHPVRPVQEALDVLREWTDRHGLELVQIPAGQQPSVAPEGEVTACDLVTALGGDGTLLKALHVAARTRTPVMGVGYGSLGALTAVPEPELIGGLDRFAAGDWTARRLPALCLATAEGELAWALNDIVLTRRGGTQLEVDVTVGEELYVRAAGDGMIVATAMGSSAYSMAAGRPAAERHHRGVRVHAAGHARRLGAATGGALQLRGDARGPPRTRRL